MRYIKCRAEFVLPVPHEVGDDLDAVAEAGLELLRDLISKHVTRLQPGTLHTSWQSMPKSWAPRRSNVVLAEPIAPGVMHTVDANDRIGWVEEPSVMHPWDQGLLIFPDDHPLHDLEEQHYSAYVRTGHPSELQQQFGDIVEARQRDAKELESGDDDGDE